MKKHARIFFLLAFIALPGGCSEEGDRGLEDFPFWADSPTVITMKLVPKHQAVQRGESVRIAYLIHNRGTNTEIHLGQEFLGVEVIGPHGGALPRITSQAMEEGKFPIRLWDLHKNDVVGSVVDLTCAFPLQTREDTRFSPPCTWLYDFDEPGQYRVVMHYWTVPAPEIREPRRGVDYLQLMSDTAIVVLK
jgi:hypothetical protein